VGRTDTGILTREIKYKPLPSQRRFHESAARFKGFSGPIGSGKSQALCHEALKLAYLNRGALGLIGAPTYPMLRDATMTAFLSVLNDNDIPYDLNKSENAITLTDTESRIIFRAVDDFERLRGMNLAWFGMDELSYSPEEAWTRLEGRLRDPAAIRLCGFGVWTPKGHDWVYRRFIKNRVDGYEVVKAAPFENRYVLGKIGDFYDRLKGSYDEQFYKQEVLGEYINASGNLVYSAFDLEVNAQTVKLDPRKPLRWALDFNVDPMSSVVAQIDGEQVKVLDEIVIRRATTFDACEEFRNRFGSHVAGVVVYADASGNNRQTTGTSDIAILKDFLIRAGYSNVTYNIPTANPPVRERIRLVNAKLKNATGASELTIAPNCTELIKDFEEVMYKPDTTIVDKDRDPKRTHLSDALGYLIHHEFHARGKYGEQRRRLPGI
jgi:hypothetical protein